MRLLFLSPGFPADEYDTSCIPPLQVLARGLLLRGAELHVVSLYPFTEMPYNWHGARVYPCNGPVDSPRRWWANVQMYRRAARLLRAQRFDAIHSFWLGPAWIVGNLLTRRFGVPHFTTLMGQDVLPQNRYLHFLRRRHADSLIALCPYHNNIFEKNTSLRAAYEIPWGVEPAEIPESVAQERLIDVLGVGSLIPLKNWTLWLDTLKLLTQKRPYLRAELLGEGPERTRLEALIVRAGLRKNVCLRGALPREQVLERMRQSKVLLHSSLYESFGFVLPEAAMSGCRLVSTPVGIAPQMAATASDAAGLAGLVEQALKSGDPDASTSPFSSPEMLDAYEKLYRKGKRSAHCKFEKIARSADL